MKILRCVVPRILLLALALTWWARPIDSAQAETVIVDSFNAPQLLFEAQPGDTDLRLEQTEVAEVFGQARNIHLGSFTDVRPNEGRAWSFAVENDLLHVESSGGEVLQVEYGSRAGRSHSFQASSTTRDFLEVAFEYFQGPMALELDAVVSSGRLNLLWTRRLDPSNHPFVVAFPFADMEPGAGAADPNDILANLDGLAFRINSPSGEFAIDEVRIRQTYFGDANLDGELDSADLVEVFRAGEYEDDVPLNSTWATGDWDGDGEFTSSDLVFAFQDGGYEDGDIDVLATTLCCSNDIAWYENTDGRGQFGEKQVIAAGRTPTSLLPVDFDGDGDVMATFRDEGHKVVWYENTDGTGTFGDQRSIAPGSSFGLGDLDGDGDADLTVSTWGLAYRPEIGEFYYTGKLFWYENLDGAAKLSPAREMATDAGSVLGLEDNDGDSDLLVRSRKEFLLYENVTGGLSWREQSLLSMHRGAYSSRIADVNGDGKLDLLSATSIASRVAWHEERLIGDSNRDSAFDSGDLVAVFRAGKYQDDIPNNATYDEGDWNQDGDFGSSDLVLAFQEGHYEAGAIPRKSEIAAAVDWLLTQDADAKKSGAFVA